MATLLEARMATNGGRGGRPKKSDEDRGTKHVRVFHDMGQMIAWIVRFRNKSSAEYLDPIIRAKVVSDFVTVLPQAKAIKAAEDDARREQGLPPTEPLPVVAILTGRESPEEIAAKLAEADAEQKAFNEAGEGEGAEEEPVKGKRKKKGG